MRRFQLALVVTLILASCANQTSDPEALCDLLRDSVDLNVGTELVPLDDPIEVTQNMTLYVKLFDEMSDVAPKSVKGDINTLRDFMADIRDAKTLAAGDRMTEIAAIGRITEDAQGLQAATARISAFARNECGLDLRAG